MKRGRRLKIDPDHPIERDVWYWIEHVAHWYALFFVAVSILTFAYLFLNNANQTLASLP